jgi:hypothetical protein
MGSFSNRRGMVLASEPVFCECSRAEGVSGKGSHGALEGQPDSRRCRGFGNTDPERAYIQGSWQTPPGDFYQLKNPALYLSGGFI